MNQSWQDNQAEDRLQEGTAETETQPQAAPRPRPLPAFTPSSRSVSAPLALTHHGRSQYQARSHANANAHPGLSIDPVLSSLTSSLTIDSPAYCTTTSSIHESMQINAIVSPKLKTLHTNTNTTSSSSSSTIAMNMNPNIDTTMPSIIHDQSRVTCWKNVKALAISQPQHASYRGEDGLTALHHTCSRRCPDPTVFQALMQAYPHAIIEPDNTNRWTPLHHACRFKCPTECMKVILLGYPEYGRYAAKIREERGRTALYYAIRYQAPEGVVELLLGSMERSDILDCDNDNKSVLTLIWDNWVTTFEGKRVTKRYFDIYEDWKVMLKKGMEDGNGSSVWEHILQQSKQLREGMSGKLKDNWEKVDMILRGAFKFDLKEESGSRKWRILHAIASIKCHKSLFIMASILHPEQAREIDCNDLLGADQYQSFHATSSKAPPQSQPKSLATALHFAAKSPTYGPESDLVLRQLLLVYPEAARMKNPADESLPLHYLCENESKQHWVHDGIGRIYNAYPEAVTEQDIDGRTPLHRAARSHESCMFSNSAPAHTAATATATTTASIPPRTSAISSAVDPIGSIVQNILFAHPEVASIPDASGKFLMHSIAECAEHWDSNVQTIYDAFPAALSRRDSTTKGLPLHLVASNLDAKPSLVQKILESNPRAASMVNGEGRLPLHLACEAGKKWFGCLEELYNAYTNAVGVAEEVGRKWMPLHFAVASPYSSADTVKRILALRPEVAEVADSLGYTPFHLAVECGRDWEDGGLQSLFQANPEAIDMPDFAGKIPLVTALMNYCSDQGVSTATTSATDENFASSSSSSHSSTENYDNERNGGGGVQGQSSHNGDGHDFDIDHNYCSNNADEIKCNVLETAHLAQVNVVFHLLRSAPHVLAPIGEC